MGFSQLLGGGGGVRTEVVKIHNFFFFRMNPSLIKDYCMMLLQAGPAAVGWCSTDHYHQYTHLTLPGGKFRDLE